MPGMNAAHNQLPLAYQLEFQGPAFIPRRDNDEQYA